MLSATPPTALARMTLFSLGCLLMCQDQLQGPLAGAGQALPRPRQPPTPRTAPVIKWLIACAMHQAFPSRGSISLQRLSSRPACHSTGVSSAVPTTQEGPGADERNQALGETKGFAELTCNPRPLASGWTLCRGDALCTQEGAQQRESPSGRGPLAVQASPTGRVFQEPTVAVHQPALL